METTERTREIARRVWHLKRVYLAYAFVPGRGRPLMWAEYVRLVACVLAEYGQEGTS